MRSWSTWTRTVFFNRTHERTTRTWSMGRGGGARAAALMALVTVLSGAARGVPGTIVTRGGHPVRRSSLSPLRTLALSVLVCRPRPPRACGRRTSCCDVCAQRIDFDTVKFRCRRLLETRPASFMLFACAAAAALQLSCRSIASWERARKIVGPTGIALQPAPQQREAGMPRSWMR